MINLYTFGKLDLVGVIIKILQLRVIQFLSLCHFAHWIPCELGILLLFQCWIMNALQDEESVHYSLCISRPVIISLVKTRLDQVPLEAS